jgi:hypothetical protein
LGKPRRKKETRKTKVKMYCVEDDLKTLGVRRWRTKAEDREEWAITGVGNLFMLEGRINLAVIK